MAIFLSNSFGSSSGSGQPAYEFHGLRRTADGMLVYTLEDLNSSAVIDTRTGPIPGNFSPFEEEYVEALPAGRPKNPNGDLNYPEDKYQQYKLIDKKVRYFIDDDGYLVARLNANYNYAVIGPK